MSDTDAPARYAEPAIDRSSREGSLGLVVLLALGIAVAAVGLAVSSHEAAEPFVLAILAGLSVIGVFCLFAGAVGILSFGDGEAQDDTTKAFADNLTDGALITDRSGRVVYANAAYRRLVGQAGDAVITVERAFAGRPNLSEPIFRLARAAQQGRRHVEEVKVEGEGLDINEPPKWLRLSVRTIPATPANKSRSLLVWLVSDITDERRREEDAFEKVAQAITYLDSAPAGFLAADDDGRILYFNATLAQWLGIDLGDIEGGDLQLATILSEGGAALVARGAAQDSGEARRIDLELVAANGAPLPVRILYKPSRTGALKSAIVLNRSPGEAGEAGAAELRFSRFFHAAPIAIATVDRSGRIGQSNTAFARMFGGSGDKSSRRTHLPGLFEGDVADGVRTSLEKAALNRGLMQTVDVTFDVSQREPRSGRLFISPIEKTSGDQEAAIVYAIDTTEQRALEMQIVQSQKMQAVGQLAGGIAHDFNNVLTAIIGVSDFLLMNHTPSDPAFQDIMNIKQNANRAAGLVRQLLAFSRQQTLRPQVLDVNSRMTDLTVLLARLLGEKVELTVVPGRDVWPIKADLHQLEQVIINLAVNARDAMADGGQLTIRTANLTEAQSRAAGHTGFEPGDYVLIEVTDTGSGMTPEIMEKIFEPFFSTKEVGKGTGLGLSTVYGIVKQTGGFIYPESEPGRGTVFRVYLPRHIPTAEEPAVEVRAPEKAKPRDLTGTGTILLVEDEDAVRAFAARALQTRGYTVYQASTGTEALEVMAEIGGKVDLVVSDVVMPEMDGPTLLKHLRETDPSLKIIFMSGYAEDAFKRNLDENETFAFLQKPFDLKQLAEAVKTTLMG